MHLDAAHHQERAIPDRHASRADVLLLRASIQAPVLERPARTPLDDLGDRVRIRLVGQNPGPAVQLEYMALAAQALADMNAEIEVEADLDLSAAVHLAHGLHVTSRC